MGLIPLPLTVGDDDLWPEVVDGGLDGVLEGDLVLFWSGRAGSVAVSAGGSSAGMSPTPPATFAWSSPSPSCSAGSRSLAPLPCSDGTRVEEERKKGE